MLRVVWSVIDRYDWTPGDHVPICGVKIPDNYALELEQCKARDGTNPTPFNMSFVFSEDWGCVRCKLHN